MTAPSLPAHPLLRPLSLLLVAALVSATLGALVAALRGGSLPVGAAYGLYVGGLFVVVIAFAPFLPSEDEHDALATRSETERQRQHQRISELPQALGLGLGGLALLGCGALVERLAK